MGSKIIVWSTILALVFLLYGCGLIPYGMMDGDRYKYFFFGYSVEVPEGWEGEEQKNLAEILLGNKLTDTSFEMTNPKTSSRITMRHGYFNEDFNTMLFKSYQKWDREFTEHRENDIKKTSVRIESYEIHREGLDKTMVNYLRDTKSFRPEKFYEEKISRNTGNQRFFIHARWYYYPTNGDDTSLTIIQLTTLNNNYDADYPAFDLVTSSLLAHDYSAN